MSANMALHESNMQKLVDPVCGIVVNAESTHRYAYGGAMIFFCSEECRVRFIADPLHFIVISVQNLDVPVPIRNQAEKGICEDSDRLAAGEQSDNKPDQELEHRLRGGLRGLIESWRLAWREGRHVSRTSRELLALYRTVSAENPGLTNREIYKLVVMSRNSCDATIADAILQSAEESYARWPAKRELTLCDVVHYLTVSEFFILHKGENWTRSDTSRAVASRIPRNLCIPRKR